MYTEVELKIIETHFFQDIPRTEYPSVPHIPRQSGLFVLKYCVELRGRVWKGEVGKYLTLHVIY